MLSNPPLTFPLSPTHSPPTHPPFTILDLASLRDNRASFSLQAQVVSVLGATDVPNMTAEQQQQQQQPLRTGTDQSNVAGGGGGDKKNIGNHSVLRHSGRDLRKSGRDNSILHKSSRDNSIRHKGSRDSSRETSQRIAEVIIEHHQAHTSNPHAPGLGLGQGQGPGPAVGLGPQGTTLPSQPLVDSFTTGGQYPLEYTNAEVQVQEINAINLAKLQMKGSYQRSSTPSMLGR